MKRIGIRRPHPKAPSWRPGPVRPAVLLLALALAAAGFPLALAPAAPVAAMTQDPSSYVYNEWGTAVPAPPLYSATRQFSGSDLGTGPLKEARDLFFDEAEQELYLVDSANNRILVLDPEYRLVRTLDAFPHEGETLTLNSPGGLFVSAQGLLYIADSENGRILVTDRTGAVLRIHGKPESELIASDFVYKPQKIVVDRAERMYIQATGVFEGLLSLDAQGRFLQYFGSNRVEMTAQMLIDLFWKRILSREQRERMASFVPIEYSNAFIDRDDFIYATVVKSTNSYNELKKLNALGNNVLRISPFSTTLYPRNDYGDHPVAWIDAKPYDTMFSDVLVSPDGVIHALDAQRGRVFLYDEDSNLLGVFGGQGEQLGSFRQPSSFVLIGQRLVVLDAMKNTLTEFVPTPFGDKVFEATRLYGDGLYLEATEPWQDVLRMCVNYNLAYIGLGKSHMRLEEYREAMRDFRLGYDRKGYSDALKELSLEFGRRNLGWILLGILLLGALGFLWFRRRKARGKRSSRNAFLQEVRLALRTLIHPIDVSERIKYDRRGNLTLAVALIALVFLTSVITRQATGFPFNPNEIDAINILIVFLGSGGLLLLWIVANVALTNMMEGEASPYEVVIGTGYSMLPYILVALPLVVLTNLLSLEAAIFLQAASVLSLAWCGVLFVATTMTLHQFRFRKTLGYIVLTILGMAAAAFVLMLVVSLLQQVYVFLYTIYNEIMFRM